MDVKTTRRRILIGLGVFLAVVAVYAIWFNPAHQGDASDAFYACADRLAPAEPVGGPGDVSYSGHDGDWVITGMADQGDGSAVSYVCHATRVSPGVYDITLG